MPGDDPFYDPRIAWARKNNEDMAKLLAARTELLDQKKIYNELIGGPKFTRELCELTGMETGSIVWHVKRMARKGIKIDKKKVKDRMQYTLR